MSIYTKADWEKDRTFNAEAGQEISEEIYNDMLNCMPPENLPRSKAEQALQDYSIPVHAGFLMGEPHSCNKDGDQLYLAFGMNDYGKGKHYYYLGLSIKAPELHGKYYYFDCLNAVVNKYFLVSAFKDDNDAIKTAADYEATLYKYEFRHGERVSSAVLYDPWDCFNNEMGAN